MHKKLQCTTTAPAIESGSALTRGSGAQKKHAPLTEDAVRPSLVFLDARYLIGLANSGYPIEESLNRLKCRSKGELVMTSQVMDELERSCSEKRRASGGSSLLERKSLGEIRNCIYSGLVSFESVTITDNDRQQANEQICARNESKGSSISEGELSIWVLGEKLKDIFDHIVLSLDSEIKSLWGQDSSGSDNSREKDLPRSVLHGFSTSQVIKAFEFLGYRYVGRNGEHIMRNPETCMTASIPDAREVAKGTLSSILRDNGLSRRTFIQAMNAVGVLSKAQARELLRQGSQGAEGLADPVLEGM